MRWRTALAGLRSDGDAIWAVLDGPKGREGARFAYLFGAVTLRNEAFRIFGHSALLQRRVLERVAGLRE